MTYIIKCEKCNLNIMTDIGSNQNGKIYICTKCNNAITCAKRNESWKFCMVALFLPRQVQPYNLFSHLRTFINPDLNVVF